MSTSFTPSNTVPFVSNMPNSETEKCHFLRTLTLTWGEPYRVAWIEFYVLEQLEKLSKDRNNAVTLARITEYQEILEIIKKQKNCSQSQYL